MDPAIQQFFAAQMQLLQNLPNTVQNLQAQQNQPPPHAPPPPPNKHKEFMSYHPPTYSHSVDPLDVDDWLKTINKMLNITQCNDHEKVLYASGRLEGAASDWWDAYTAAHAAADTITWQEFQESFCTHHIPTGVKKLKQKEFLALKQGNMTVSEYLDEFTHLSHYAPDEVNTDAKRQEHFLDGLIGPLNYHLQSHTFPIFQMLLNKAIGLENKCKELGEQKHKFQSQGQSSSNTRPRYNSSQGFEFCSSRQGGNHRQNQQFSHSFEQPEEFNPVTPRAPNPHQNCSGAPVKNNTPVHPSGCFNCRELGHYASICLQRNMQTPQKGSGQRLEQPSSQVHIGNPSFQGNRGQQNYMHGRVNHVTAEEAQ
jgi:hypothetical protein